jgi:hypothetical protein
MEDCNPRYSNSVRWCDGFPATERPSSNGDIACSWATTWWKCASAEHWDST